jgi:hypothetical protein
MTACGFLPRDQPRWHHGGFQDKVQLDPSEDATYSAGSARRFSMRVRSRSAWQSVMKAGDIRKPFAGPSGKAAQLVFHRTFMKPNGRIPAVHVRRSSEHVS